MTTKYSPTSSKNFVETKLVTKFADFNIRVYKNIDEKENLVLWTKNLDITQPVLVRVHSECLTGDTLGSLHCDCGKQLDKSLQFLGKKGGAIIYLRQEGRGIGLFEKMKSYQMQSLGSDTFEANVLLGHQPDQRSYEMVKTILDDLSITKIRLLTNNPSKVSEIAKLGIEVVEIVPIISRANKHNKKYLETKRIKFQHSIKKTAPYFYQFHVETPTQVEQIEEFVKTKNNDPLLKICIGIHAESDSLNNKNRIKEINDILDACYAHPHLTPSLHFSFKKSSDILKDLHKIKLIYPTINRLQINDIPILKVGFIKRACKLFQVDIPLSEENFQIVYDARFRSVVKQNQSIIMLDNSKGMGIKESEVSFMKKIDILLSYGLNNIALCGGFGPDELDIYFLLRRYYKINFSIDAETKLKTNNKVDLEKTKLYLNQLIHFNDPKQEKIEQTKKFLEKHRRLDWEKIQINNHEFSIHPKVFHSGFFPSTAWFATELCNLMKNEANFCEVGCGSGVISCLLASSNPKLKIIATDINPYGSENTKLNAVQLGLASQISVQTGDVLDAIPQKKYFNSIFWSLPFGYLDPGTSINLEETQVFDPGYRAIRKFFKTAKKYLMPNGRLLLGFSSDLGHLNLLYNLAEEFSLKLTTLKETSIKENVEIKFELLEGKFF